MIGPDSQAAVPSETRRTASGLRGRLASLVGYVVNPLVLPPVVYGLALSHVGAPAEDVAAGVGVAGVFLGLVPLAHVGWMRWRGAVGSLEIRDRRKRTEPFLGGVAAGLAALLLAGGLDVVGRALLVALLGCHVLNTILLFVISSRWKISVHCASLAGAVSTLAFFQWHIPGILFGTLVTDGIVLGVGGSLALLLVWARVESRAHTLRQALAGTALGLLAPYGELYLLALGGWM